MFLELWNAWQTQWSVIVELKQKSLFDQRAGENFKITTKDRFQEQV